jgi:hypothetical protein
MLLELALKYNLLEEKITEINKFVVKKTKKININEYLNKNIEPQHCFNEIHNTIDVTNEDVEYLFKNSVFETMNNLFTKSLYVDENSPLMAFIQKKNTLFCFIKENDESKWLIITKEKLSIFLNLVQLKLSKALYEWKKKNQQLLNENDSKCIIYDKTISKLMTPDFKSESVLNKIKNLLYSNIKKDMKGVLEYEFEF